MYSTGYYATGYYSTGYYLGGAVAPSKGGDSDARHEKAREETRRLKKTKKEELDKLFPEGIGAVVEELITTGTTTVGNTEIDLPGPVLKRPILVLPKKIDPEIDKKIAQAFYERDKKALADKKVKYEAATAKAREDHTAAQAEYKKKLKKYEEKLIVLIMLAILD